MSEFPDLPRWVHAMQTRDNAVLMIAVVAFALFIWMVLFRFIPRLRPLLPAYRVVLVVAYLVSLVLILAGVIK